MRKDAYDRVLDIQRQLLEYKNTQKLSSSSVKIFTIESANEWDATWTKVSNTPSSEYFIFKFTPDSQIAPFASLRLRIQVNGVDWNPVGASYLPAYVSEGTGQSIVSVQSSPIFFSVFIGDYAPIGSVIRVKIKVLATDTGIIEGVPK